MVPNRGSHPRGELGRISTRARKQARSRDTPPRSLAKIFGLDRQNNAGGSLHFERESLVDIEAMIFVVYFNMK